MPYTKLITATVKDRDFVRRLIGVSVEIIRAYGQALKDAGASIFVLCEHDVQMFSPTDFKELSLHFLPDLLDLYPHTMLHLCGKATLHLQSNLDALLSLRVLSMINVGSDVELGELKGALAGRIGVAGNIDHLLLLPGAAPAEVTEASRLAIEAGMPSGGLMLAPGCEITADTPAANVGAFVAAARQFGVYQ